MFSILHILLYYAKCDTQLSSRFPWKIILLQWSIIFLFHFIRWLSSIIIDLFLYWLLGGFCNWFGRPLFAINICPIIFSRRIKLSSLLWCLILELTLGLGLFINVPVDNVFCSLILLLLNCWSWSLILLLSLPTGALLAGWSITVWVCDRFYIIIVGRHNGLFNIVIVDLTILRITPWFFSVYWGISFKYII